MTRHRSSRPRGKRLTALAAAVLALGSCFVHPPPSVRSPRARVETPSPGRDRTIVLVAIDGVRWQEVFLGVDPKLARRQRFRRDEIVGARELMPNLHRLLETRGAAVGAPSQPHAMVASGPHYVSLPGYIEMLSGVGPSGCSNNECGRTPWKTLADELADTRRGDRTQVAVVSSWPLIEQAAAKRPQAIALSTGRHGGETREALLFDGVARSIVRRGERSSPHPGHGDFRPDRFTAELGLHVLRARAPGFLFIGLGETDEYGHRNDYRSYLRALTYADSVVGEVAAIVRELNAGGHPTTLFVTSDHGRAQNFVTHGAHAPESARTWLVAAGAGVRARGAVVSPRRRRLADIAPTIRYLVGAAPPIGSPSGEVLTELLAAGPGNAGADSRLALLPPTPDPWASAP